MHKKFERAVLRIILYIVLVLSCYLIQTTVMRNFMYKPNMLLIATCLIGFIYGDYDGMFSDVGIRLSAKEILGI